MTMQYDVKSANLNQSGFCYVNGTVNRTRLKQVTYAPTGGGAGTLIFFDTVSTPVSATYSRSGTTITVLSTGHGLSTGQQIGIGFLTSSGSSATDGNFKITVSNANAFTITDVNSGSISGGTGCYYVPAYTTPNGDTRYQYPQRWLTAIDTFQGQTSTQQVTIPGEGIVVNNGLYAQLSTIAFTTVFYG